MIMITDCKDVRENLNATENKEALRKSVNKAIPV